MYIHVGKNDTCSLSLSLMLIQLTIARNSIYSYHLSLNEFRYWVRHLNYRKPYRTYDIIVAVAKWIFGMQITPPIITTQRVHSVSVCVWVCKCKLVDAKIRFRFPPERYVYLLNFVHSESTIGKAGSRIPYPLCASHSSIRRPKFYVSKLVDIADDTRAIVFTITFYLFQLAFLQWTPTVFFPQRNAFIHLVARFYAYLCVNRRMQRRPIIRFTYVWNDSLFRSWQPNIFK